MNKFFLSFCNQGSPSNSASGSTYRPTWQERERERRKKKTQSKEKRKQVQEEGKSKSMWNIDSITQYDLDLYFRYCFKCLMVTFYNTTYIEHLI